MAYKNIFTLGSFLIIVPLLFILLTTQGHNEKTVFKKDIDQHILCLNPDKEFGIVRDSFRMESHRIRWNQNLAEILNRHNIGSHSVHEITQEVDKVFDVTKFKAGNKYHIYYEPKDSARKMSYFVYQHTPKEYVKDRKSVV